MKKEPKLLFKGFKLLPIQDDTNTVKLWDFIFDKVIELRKKRKRYATRQIRK